MHELRAGKRQATSSSKPDKSHTGWTSAGACFRSELAVENTPTRFVLYLLKEIRRDFLSPQDVHFLILREGLTTAFPCHEKWATLDRFWHWPLAVSRTSAEEVVRSLGGKYPWVRDEYAWTSWCDAAEKKYGYEPRLVRNPEMPHLSEIG